MKLDNVPDKKLVSAFSLVKKDILDLKRSINAKLLRMDELEKKLDNQASKNEFYRFMRKLDDEVKELEYKLVGKEEVDTLKDELKNDIEKLQNQLKKQDSMKEELVEIRRLKGKLLSLEGVSVNVREFNSVTTELSIEINKIKKNLVESEQLKKKLAELNRIRKTADNIKKNYAAKKELERKEADTKNRIDEINANLEKLYNHIKVHEENERSFASRDELKQNITDFDLKLSKESKEILDLKEDIINAENRFVEGASFNEKTRELENKIGYLASTLKYAKGGEPESAAQKESEEGIQGVRTILLSVFCGVFVFALMAYFYLLTNPLAFPGLKQKLMFVVIILAVLLVIFFVPYHKIPTKLRKKEKAEKVVEERPIEPVVKKETVVAKKKPKIAKKIIGWEGIKKGICCVFVISLILLLILLIIKEFIALPFINTNYFIAFVVVFGLLSLFLQPKEQEGKKNYFVIFLIGIIGGVYIAVKTKQLGWLSYVVGVVCAVLIIMLSIMLTEEEMENNGKVANSFFKTAVNKKNKVSKRKRKASMWKKIADFLKE